jgi:hypothetical protein
LAIITFVGGEEPEQTEKAMQILWQVANPKLGPNVCSLSVLSHSPREREIGKGKKMISSSLLAYLDGCFILTFYA